MKSVENQQDDASDTGDLLDDADENTETDRDEDELQQLSWDSPPDIIRSNIFSFQRLAKRCILIIAMTVDPAILKNKRACENLKFFMIYIT